MPVADGHGLLSGTGKVAKQQTFNLRFRVRAPGGPPSGLLFCGVALSCVDGGFLPCACHGGSCLLAGWVRDLRVGRGRDGRRRGGRRTRCGPCEMAARTPRAAVSTRRAVAAAALWWVVASTLVWGHPRAGCPVRPDQR